MAGLPTIQKTGPNRDQLCFGSLTSLKKASSSETSGKPSKTSGFQAKDIDDIKQRMALYTFGKDVARMLDPDSRMHAFDYTHEGKRYLVLQNFDFLPDSKQGICFELAQHLREELHHAYKGRYQFEMAYGNSAEFFIEPQDEHVFLLGWPQDLDSDVRRQLKQNPCKIPDGAIVIDPSFGVISGDPRAEHYKLRGLTTPEKIPESKGDWSSFTRIQPEVLSGHAHPIGFLSNLDPSAMPQDGRNPMIFILFCLEKDGRAGIRLLRRDSAQGEYYQWKNWKEEVAPDSLLRRFLDKKNMELATPPDRATAERLSYLFPSNSSIIWLKYPNKL